MIRRTIDILVAAALLVLTAPLVAAIAGLNWVTTRRVFFTQTRIGQNLQPFAIVKFQTMVDGAVVGSTVTAPGDRRVTPVGRILRALRLDELPQLLNVLRGEMSLVGPRPLTPNEVAVIPPDVARQVYAVAPGMTGIAVLAIDEEHVLGAFPNPEDAYFTVVLPQKITLEFAYAQRRTWLSDLAILALTPLAMPSLLPGLRRAAVTRLVPSPPSPMQKERTP